MNSPRRRRSEEVAQLVPLLGTEEGYDDSSEREKQHSEDETWQIRIKDIESRRAKRSHPGCLVGRLAVSAYLWVMLPLAMVLSLLTQVMWWLLLWPLFIAKPRARSITLGLTFRFWQTLAAFWLNPFWNFKLIRPPNSNLRPSGKLLFVCNHTTGADPWITARAVFPWELKWVFKGDLLNIPIVGWVIRMSGDIPLFFTQDKGGWGTRPGAVAEMMRQVKQIGEEQNIGCVVYPEGTRSKTGQLQVFKDGFFRFAIENGREILPCIAHNGQALWPLGSGLFGYGTVYWCFGETVVPEPDESVESLKERVRNQMVELQRLCPLFDPELDAPLDRPTETRGQGAFGTSEKKKATWC